MRLVTKEKRKEYNASYYSSLKGWLSSKIKTIRRHERKHNYKSDVTRSYLKKLIVKDCPALGCELIYGHTGGRTPNLATIDKIDPLKGYVRGNIQILSDLANVMKSNATRKELVLFAEWVLRHERR